MKGHRIMKKQLSRILAIILLTLFSLSPAWATCGGGGGGGTGGVGGGNSSMGPTPTVYKVPWKLWESRTAAQKGLVLYWFPASNDEVKKSPLLTSRILTDRKSTRLNSSHLVISYAVFCLKKKKQSTFHVL